MEYKVLLDVLKRRKAKNFDSKGLLDEEPDQKPDLKAQETAVMGGEANQILKSQEQEDELLPDNRSNKGASKENSSKKGEVESEDEEKLTPFGRAKKKVDDDYEDEGSHDSAASPEVEEDVYDDAVYDRIKKGKKPRGLYERMQANLGKKLNKKR